ncbi:hypothetical protein F5X97DRAFT_36905 [Nemania serpens]|nr:hypothetical protein F5X97DRAFT_36905 [Nemania serpens]
MSVGPNDLHCTAWLEAGAVTCCSCACLCSALTHTHTNCCCSCFFPSVLSPPYPESIPSHISPSSGKLWCFRRAVHRRQPSNTLLFLRDVCQRRTMLSVHAHLVCILDGISIPSVSWSISPFYRSFLWLLASFSFFFFFLLRPTPAASLVVVEAVPSRYRTYPAQSPLPAQRWLAGGGLGGLCALPQWDMGC